MTNCSFSFLLVNSNLHSQQTISQETFQKRCKHCAISVFHIQIGFCNIKIKYDGERVKRIRVHGHDRHMTEISVKYV